MPRLETLPKWAQDMISRQAREIAALEMRTRRQAGEGPSAISVNESPDPRVDDVADHWANAVARVKFRFPGPRAGYLEVFFDGDRLNFHGSKGVAVRPLAANSFTVAMEDF